jgi:hypothetical protein
MLEVSLNLAHMSCHFYLSNFRHPDLVPGAAIFAGQDKRDSTLVAFLCQLSLCLKMRTLIPEEDPIWGGAFLIAA